MNLFVRPEFRLLERSLDASALRQKVIANNIAHAETPHFKRSEVEFEQLLQQEIANGKYISGYRTNEKHLPIGQKSRAEITATVVTDDGDLMMNNNENNVDLDYEMALLAQNQMHYNLLVQQVTHELGMLRTSIGRR